MTTYAINASYSCCVTSTFSLPDGVTHDSLADFYVKWDTFYYQVKGDDTWHEIDLSSDDSDCIDWKRPWAWQLLPCDEEGLPDFEKPLGGEE